MKRGIVLLMLIILLSSSISAEIIFTEPLKQIYNIGDIIYVPITIKTLTNVVGNLNMDLICNETSINFYKNGINMLAGDEKKIDSSLVLIRNIVGYSEGTCRIKAILGDDYVLSNEFKISDSLNIDSNLAKTNFDVGEIITLSGKVTRETGQNSDGLIKIILETDDTNQEISQLGTVTKGNFYTNLSLPEDLKAGFYFIKLEAYEEDSDGRITNSGVFEYNITINQVPTNLELILENEEINPGDSLKVKAILHDQTGEQIDTTAFITIKNSKNKILEQKEVNIGEFFEYPIKSSEAPSTWNIFVTSNKLTSEAAFKIKEKEAVKIEILNQTILVTNTGNVPYDKVLLVNVGDNPLNLQVTLNVGESKKYFLSAPEGDYDVKVSDDKSEISELMSLTGRTVEIKEISGVSSWIVLWIIIIMVLVCVVFITSRKMYSKPFFGKMIFKKKDKIKNTDNSPVTKNVNKNMAELSLSIKGEKQDASIICIRMNNLRSLIPKKGSASESIQKIIETAEENKAVPYENQDYLFFIFAPIKTKTFKNERNAVDTAEKIQKILIEHNKKFNQKIDFGISLSKGAIIAKLDNNFKFMSMGSLMGSLKKISSLSKGEILLSEKINDILRLQVKTEKNIRDGIPVFIVKEIKKEDEEARKFIDRFMKKHSTE